MKNPVAKGRGFQSTVGRVPSDYISEPVIGSNFFSVAMRMEVNMKGDAQMSMYKVCVYKVENGKIAQEQFFF
ncbi:MAG: SnoaL-like domain-containing protein [Bacteroidota bacterium]